MTEAAEERMLLRELNHRINNEFATAISVVSLAARRSNNDDVKAALSGVVELLHQYADVHSALQMPECDTLVDAATYLRRLCRSITRSLLEDRKISLVLSSALAAAGRPLLASRNDFVRADKQCRATCLFGWRWRNSRGIVVGRSVC